VRPRFSDRLLETGSPAGTGSCTLHRVNEAETHPIDVPETRYPPLPLWPDGASKDVFDGLQMLKLAVLVPIFLFLGIVVVLVLVGASASGQGQTPAWIEVAAGFSGIAVSCLALFLNWVGIAKITVPLEEAEPGEHDRPRRLLKRWTVVYLASTIVSAVLSIVSYTIQGANAYSSQAPMIWIDYVTSLWALFNWGFFVTWVAMVAWHLRFISEAVGDLKGVGKARRYIVAGPILNTVGLLACGLGPLAALILYYNLLTHVRKMIPNGVVIDVDG